MALCIVCYATLWSHLNLTCLIWFAVQLQFLANGIFLDHFDLEGQCSFAALLSSYGGIKTVYCDRQHQRWHLIFAPNQTWILQDRGRFHISPIFQMKLNFLVKSAGSNSRGRAEKMSEVDIRGNEFKLRTRVLRISASIPVNHKLKVVAFNRLP